MRPIPTILATLALGSIAACGTLLLPKASTEGPAMLIRQGNAYYALFPATADLGFSCGYSSPQGRFTPTPSLTADTEATFREAYRHYLLDDAERLHPDSMGTVAEFPGEYVVARQVPKRTYVRLQRQRFNSTIKWDRQYIGVLTPGGDSVLAINLVQPSEWTRSGLAEGWMTGLDGAADEFVALSYDVKSGRIAYLCDRLK